jgi:hypothetical protein
VKIDVRTLVGVALLLFAWKGNITELKWPFEGAQRTPMTEPLNDDQKKWVETLRPIAAGMLPADRLYLSDFYDGMKFVVTRDAARPDAVLTSTEAFARFHGESLAAAIDKDKVGIYTGLGEAIDAVYLAAIGTDDSRALTAEEKQRIVLASGALSRVFAVGSDE